MRRCLFALVATVLLWWSGWGTLPAIAQPLPATPLIASIFHFSGSRPTNLGVANGQLAPCPNTPNCVNSQTGTGNHAIAPLPANPDPATTLAQVRAVVEAQPRTAVIEATDNYLYAEFTSQLMGFVDDVEFYQAPDSDVLQVRSASRLGESDLGVNRDRVETLRQALSARFGPS